MKLIRTLPILALLTVAACKTIAPPRQPVKKEAALPADTQAVPYRETYERQIDLIHTELFLKPDWKKMELEGTANIRFKPHFYPADSFVFDAKAMEIRSMRLYQGDSLEFRHDGRKLVFRTKKPYTRNDTLEVTIGYVARPESLTEGGSDAISSDKGLYFINHDRSNPHKPRQIWTQGETESNSVWFPTIESPAQKMTQDIHLTVDSTLTTVSNGKLISSVPNADGTRTDHWRQTLRAAPYLSMIAVGEFAVINDRWENIGVDYYVDPPYGKYAGMIFGETPKMISFFSDRLGVRFPWEKFDQIAVHDYVSGAMENTTAVIHGTNMQLDPREILEGDHIDFISHELAHHWFGDLVTCESWSNITLNEGFATYCEYLWREKRYGRMDADEHLRSDLASYLRSAKDEDPPLIRFHYSDREDVFDAISYKKGACVLHMLRHLIGDDAFFTAVKKYLETHSFSATEVHELRLAFEETTGQDLNWFFDQWLLRGGHPELEITYEWIDSSSTQRVRIKQLQADVFRLPLSVDIYLGDTIVREKIECSQAVSQHDFVLSRRPDLVNVDADKSLVGTKKDRHTDDEWIFQYGHAKLFLDRYEAIQALSKDYKFGTPAAVVVFSALSDPSPRIRKTVLDKMTVWAKKDSVRTIEALKNMTISDPVPSVRLEALSTLKKKFHYTSYADALTAALSDSSYEVAATAFEILTEKDSALAMTYAETFEKDSSGVVRAALSEFYAKSSNPSHASYYERVLNSTEGWYAYQIVNSYGEYLKKQEGGTVDEGISQLEDYCKWHKGRFQRSAGVAALRSLQNSIREKKEKLSKNTAGMQEEAIKAETTVLQAQSDRITKLLETYAVKNEKE